MIFYSDDVEARKLLSEIKLEDKVLIERDEQAQVAYKALQFLIIPFLPIDQIAELLKNDIYVGLNVPDLDLKERINKKMMFEDLDSRDEYKNSLKLSLADSKVAVTSLATAEDDRKLISVSDWLKDYISNVTSAKGKLEQAKYFSQKQYFSNLRETEKENLKKLFALYDYLNTSSFSPEGFEDDMLLETEDGKLITTHKGQVVVLYDYNQRGAVQPKRGRENLAVKTTVPKNGKERRLAELQGIAAQFPAGSLQRRAIEEEIKKLGD